MSSLCPNISEFVWSCFCTLIGEKKKKTQNIIFLLQANSTWKMVCPLAMCKLASVLRNFYPASSKNWQEDQSVLYFSFAQEIDRYFPEKRYRDAVRHN